MTKLTEKVYKVYITYYTDGSYYIGFTGKSGTALASYFGSNTIKNKLVSHKEIVWTSKSKATSKLFELLLQLSRLDSSWCVNSMLNVRVRKEHMKGLPKFKLIFEDNNYNKKLNEKD
jgi:hypothetical protein|tara:strand:+ start:493 stop:843 length:351 start_codon:yes stop_codon:yes gene_type:complete